MKRTVTILFVSLLTLACLTGCPAPVERKEPIPQITVDRTETTDGVTVRIRYEVINKPQGHSDSSFTLNNLKSLQDYKQKVSFLLNQLDEAEKRMKVREQSEK